MPLTKEYLPYLMFLWVFSGVITIRRIDINYSGFQLLLIVLPALFYLIHGVGLFYTSDLRSGLFDLEMKLSLLFVPVVIMFLTNRVKQNFSIILRAFVWGNLVALLIMLFKAFESSFILTEAGKLVFEPSYWTSERDLSFFQLVNQRYSHFSYSFFSFIHHPSYFSMYVLFAFSLVVFFYREDEHKRSVRSSFTFASKLIFLTVMIWFLGSRAGYLAYTAVFLGLIIFFMIKTQKYLISFGLIVTGFVLLTVFMSPQLKKNIHEVIHQVENQQELTSESDIRLWLWKSGIEVYRENYLWGVGTGDIKEEMIEKYHQYNLSLAEDKNYNLHNQYLESALGLGILGLFSLLFWILSVIVYAISSRSFLLFFFTLILSIHFMFESMLNSIAGVSFFTFFYGLLLAKNKTGKKEFS
jgi:O-antigen ligase